MRLGDDDSADSVTTGETNRSRRSQVSRSVLMAILLVTASLGSGVALGDGAAADPSVGPAGPTNQVDTDGDGFVSDFDVVVSVDATGLGGFGDPCNPTVVVRANGEKIGEKNMDDCVDRLVTVEVPRSELDFSRSGLDLSIELVNDHYVGSSVADRWDESQTDVRYEPRRLDRSYSVTVEDADHGSVTVDPPGRTVDGISRDYPGGRQVTLTAKPDDGYVFSHWVGDYPDGSRTDRSITVTIDESKTVKPQFVENEGSIRVDVRHENGNRATEVNALIVQRRGEPGYREIIPSGASLIDVPKLIENLPAGEEYRIDAYINDQFAGTTGWIDVTAGETQSVEITAPTPVWIRPLVTYSDGEPLAGATVKVYSHERVQQDDDPVYTWRQATTNADGRVQVPNDRGHLYLLPEDDNGAFYRIEVYYDGERVAVKRVDDLQSNREVPIQTDVRQVDLKVVGTTVRDEGDGDGNYLVGEPVGVGVRVENRGSELPVRVNFEFDRDGDGRPDPVDLAGDGDEQRDRRQVTRGDVDNTVVESGGRQSYGLDLAPREAGETRFRVELQVYRDGDWETVRTTDWLESFTVRERDVNGTIVGYESPTAGAEYELDRPYDVSLRVKNTGNVETTFTVRAPEASGRRSQTTSKEITLAPGETGTVTFTQRWYGTYTQTRSFTHDLLADTDGDGSAELLDESSVTLVEPPTGSIKVLSETGDGKTETVRVTVTDVDTGDTVEETTFRVGGETADGRILPLQTGTYRVEVSAEGYRTRTKTVEVQSGKQRVVETKLVPTGVDATIVEESLRVDSGTYTTGDVVTATVTVENTGDKPWEFFVGYSVRHGESQRLYSNEGQTGTFVTLAPGERQTVTVEWRVDDGAESGAYDAIAAVWYGYPEDGADRIDDTSWQTAVFEVQPRTETRDVTYNGTTYTIERFTDGTFGVYDETGELVSADRARVVLQYFVFREESLDDPDAGWEEDIDEASDLQKFYWLSHLTQASITAYKAYVNAQFGGYEDSIGEFLDISLQATRLMREQRQFQTTAGWLYNQSSETKELYELYSEQKRIRGFVEFTETAYRIKRTSDKAETMADAVRLAETSSDASGTLTGEVVSVGLKPLDDVSAGLETTQKQSLVTYNWAKNSRAVLEMMRELEQKRRAGTITSREIKLYYVVQMYYYRSLAETMHRLAKLERAGDDQSIAFDVISDLQGNSPSRFESIAKGNRQIVADTVRRMGIFLNRSSALTNRSINVRDDPEQTRLDRPEPLVVEVTSWQTPGDPVEVHVESRGSPVVEAQVEIGGKVVRTDRDGNASVVLLDKGVYNVTVQKDGFRSATATVTVRDPRPAEPVFDPISVGTVGGDIEVTEVTAVENTGETTLNISSVTAPKAGVSAEVVRGSADPGERLVVEVTVDTSELAPGAFGTAIVLRWENLEGTVNVTVSGNVSRTAPVEGTLSGEVRDQSGVPLSGASVEVLKDGTTVDQTEPGPDGRFSLTLPEGTYTVVVSTDTGVRETREITVAGEEVRTVTVEVTRPNHPPSAVTDRRTTATSGETVTLEATGSTDPDGDTLQYSWRQTAGPSVTLSDADSETATFTAPAVDSRRTLEFEVTVSDGRATDTETVVVTVTPSGNQSNESDNTTETTPDNTTETTPDNTTDDSTTLLEIVADDDASITYRIVVDGDAEKTRVTEKIKAEGNDEITERDDGTVVIEGFTGNEGYGDSYEITGEIVNFERVSGDASITIRLDGDPVDPSNLGEDSDGDTPPDTPDTPESDSPQTFEIVATNDASITYRVVVCGDAEKTRVTEKIKAEGNDEITERDDGTVVIEGFTGNEGYGDSFEITGEIVSFERVSGDAEIRLELDGKTVSPGDLRDGSCDGDGSGSDGGTDGRITQPIPMERQARWWTPAG